VAELTFTLALNLSHHLSYQDHYVKSGAYSRSGLFTNYTRTFHELRDKQWGIIGMGAIGKRVAELATCFGAQVSYYSTSGKNKDANFPQKSLEMLLKDSDIISIHAPLNEQTRFMIQYDQLCLMKPEAYLINVGRGKIVHETDLARALREGKLAGAGFDVFEHEPLSAENPLIAEDLTDKVLLTPHIAWASIEARQRLVEATAAHILAFSKTVRK
jgi:glycerate dehydrogenase